MVSQRPGNTLKSLNGDVLTFEDDSQCIVEPNATITLNNRPAQLGDLHAGDQIVTHGNPAQAVIATRPK